MRNPNLREWFLKRRAAQFPGRKRNYVTQFLAFEQYMFKDVHPQIEKMALAADGGFLTDHGPEHINTVIDRASFMLGVKPVLSPYETYILLAAIHLHDVGNIYGRVGHEERHAEVIAMAGSLLGTDPAEIRLIQQIAAAHGGKDDRGNPLDSIGDLVESDHFLTEDVQVQALAGILRFADELADDSERAGRLALAIDRMPEEARLYHEYALSLHSVKVRPPEKSIELRFNLDSESACRVFVKDGSPRYLLDEIYDRTLKMHRELIYCSRYMRRIVWLDTINVKIDIFVHRENIQPWKVVAYSLREVGYPQRPMNILDFVKQPHLDGATLRGRLESEGARHDH